MQQVGKLARPSSGCIGQQKRSTRTTHVPRALRARDGIAAEGAARLAEWKESVGKTAASLALASLVGLTSVAATVPQAYAADAQSRLSAAAKTAWVPEQWSYGQQVGPVVWGGMCAEGGQQSPIDLHPKQVDKDLLPTSKNATPTVMLMYKEVPVKVVDTGHGTMQVNFPTGENKAMINGEEYTLLQYHFHTPSEHTFDGKRMEMEVHFVHKSNAGKLAVVGVMMQTPPIQGGKVDGNNGSNPGFEKTLSMSPRNGEVITGSMNPAQLLGRDASNMNLAMYGGSLTTPPCSEKVSWFVNTKPVTVSAGQVLAFQSYIGKGMDLGLNSRPVTPLNGRTVIGVNGAAASATDLKQFALGRR
ncbi:unnamed protein product [Pedinophyceae sp. YPF-701]|nr:unnamed protein product [Pedinophyceae sp. YPF-701]